ncbi:MAG: D-alanyl-D-alanine carboxypeptidase [Lachnospiraceae bacterium]|nr:D-alanyl-D-alanine carboxypeptidase [Lachnospiraceae bacterium]
MKQWWKQGILGCMLLSLAFPALPSRGEEPEAPKEPDQLYAQSAVLMDADSGRILFEKNGHEIRPMASTTKIMTLIVALENGELDSMVTISEYAAGMPDVQLNARKGERYRLEDLLCSLMLESHNDSAVAIAEYVAEEMRQEETGTVADRPKEQREEGGLDSPREQREEGGLDSPKEQPEEGAALDSLKEQPKGVTAVTDAKTRSKEESRELVAEFAKLMNAKARDIGCFDTHFVTPNGLDAEDEGGIHATTAADLARILRYCISQSPQREKFLEITRRPSHSFSDESGARSFSVHNHNAFLQMMEGALSGKTGFTNQAGYCYVGSLRRDGKTYIAALLACGWPNHKSYKWSDMRKLMNYGLEYYSLHSFSEVEPDMAELSPILVENGRGEEIGETVYVPVRRAEEPAMTSQEGENRQILLRTDEAIQVECQVETKLKAPVEEGQQVGSIRYLVNGEVFRTELLVAEGPVYQVDLPWCADRVLDLFLL